MSTLGFIVITFWQDKSNSTKGDYQYEHFDDVRDALDAYEDYVCGEYSRAREIAIVTARDGVPTGERINTKGQTIVRPSAQAMAASFEEAVAKGLVGEDAGEGEV